MEASELAEEFLQLSSRQRLEIIMKLYQSRSKVTAVARDLDATVAEVFRNFERLEKSGLLEKETDGTYGLTTYGKIVYNQIPAIQFVSSNKKYFTGHNFGSLPQKFIHRIGSLSAGKHYKGFTKVLEYWKQICENSEKYVYDILSEEPGDLIEPIVAKAKSGVKISSIFSESAVIPKDRQKLIEKLGVRKLVSDGLLERKMMADVSVVVILNEKEGCVMFPKAEGETDMSETFYSDDPLFHEWCLDYFNHCWNNASTFQESKLRA